MDKFDGVRVADIDESVIDQLRSWDMRYGVEVVDFDIAIVTAAPRDTAATRAEGKAVRRIGPGQQAPGFVPRAFGQAPDPVAGSEVPPIRAEGDELGAFLP